MLIELILGWEDENLSRAVFLPISLEPEGLSGRNRIMPLGDLVNLNLELLPILKLPGHLTKEGPNQQLWVRVVWRILFE